MDYFYRLKNYSGCSDSCSILAFIYIDRVLQKNPQFRVCGYNIHRYILIRYPLFRLALAAVVLAIKYQDDYYHDNEYYSKVGGISRTELNCLEVEMLNLLHFELYVHPALYSQYVEEIKKNAFGASNEVPTAEAGKAGEAEKDQMEVDMENAKTLPSNAEIMDS